MSFLNKLPYCLLTLLLIASSCSNESSTTDSLFRLVDSEHSNLTFSNDLPVDLELNIFNYMYYYNGGGLGIGDLNNDGLIDVVLSSNLGKEALYLNKGNLEFEDISGRVKVDGGPQSWTNGVALVDINTDGMLDIYLSQVGSYRNLDCRNRLFVCTGISEEGLPSYEEQAEQYGIDFKGFSTQAGFFDYDRDGDLDMYLMNHSLHHNGTFGQRSEFEGKVSDVSGDRLFENKGGRFDDVTLKAGINSTVIGYGLGLSFGDVNNDGWADIYVGNDFHENDYLYINQGDGTFKDELTSQIKHTSRFSMGVDIADINNDGWQDIVSLDMLPEDPFILKSSEGEDALDIFNFKLGYGYNHQYARNNLQLNQGDNSFKEIGAYSGIHATDWSWSALFFDMDMDRKKDLFISNGIPKRMNDIDYINYISGKDIQYKIQFDEMEQQDLGTLDKIPEIKLYNKFFKGAENMEFNDMKASIVNHEISYSNSSAYADFDNDGDYDLMTNNIDDKVFLYENISKSSPTTKIKLAGSSSNPYGVGSIVKCTYDDEVTTQQYFSTRGFQSSMLSQIIVPTDGLKSVEVIWPDGKTESRIASSEQLDFSYKNALNSYDYNFLALPAKNQDAIDHKVIKHYHKENPFVEFNREPLIPFSTSADGPALAVGDINGDGLDDIYIGSSKRKKNGLYLQAADGSFSPSELNGLATDTIYEEVDAVFSDIDNDKDLDLIIATGGNEYRLNSPYTEPLLYINDNGVLSRDQTALKDIHVTASCVEVIDVNDDGLMDLLFGARALPWAYGKQPESYLLLNKGNIQFEDVTETYFGTHELGFIRDIDVGDVNADGKEDLIVATEWDELKIYFRKNDRYVSSVLSSGLGWWNNVLLVDVDNDNDLDLFAGNLGLNTRFSATKDEPVKMYYADFDDNGTAEQLLTYYVSGREIPFSNLKELQKQIPILKKKYLFAQDFAKASVTDIFSQSKIKSALKYEANHFETSLYLNDGAGNFSKIKLPDAVQYSTCNTAIAMDINGDGYQDIIPGYNYHYCNVQMGRYDADNGSVLINKKGDGFSYKNISGVRIGGQVSNVASVTRKDGPPMVFFSQNNDSLKTLEFHSLIE